MKTKLKLFTLFIAAVSMNVFGACGDPNVHVDSPQVAVGAPQVDVALPALPELPKVPTAVEMSVGTSTATITSK
jgi:hypothetical protein